MLQSTKIFHKFYIQFSILILILLNLKIYSAATIVGSLSVPNEYKKNANFQDIFYKDIILHLEGSPGTSKIAYPVFNSGKFSFYNVENGHSYILSAESNSMRYRPVRIDVNKKGTVRVRQASRIDPNKIDTLTYPVKLLPLEKPQHFHIRQQFNIVSMVMGNPMILLMGGSFLLMFILPKLVDMNDPEVKKELENNMGMFGKNNQNNQQLPDVAEFMSNMFGSGDKKASIQASKKRK